MASVLECFADELVAASDSDTIWEQTARLGYDFGFDSCSLTMATAEQGQLNSTCLKTDMPEEFYTGYLEGGVINLDPFLLFTCKGLMPSKILVDDLSNFPGASAENRRMLDLVQTLGYSKGFGIPVRTRDQNVFGGWVFSTNQPLSSFEKLQKNHGAEIHLATVLAYERMMALGMISDVPERILSERERECLLWLCAGFRVSKISDKLTISESAVNLYITNAKLKLGAKTREQAIARAIISGEIEL